MRDEAIPVGVLVMVAFIIGLLCAVASYNSGKESANANAVAAGVAEWTYTTNSLGQLTQSGFRYKTNSLAK